MKIIKKIMVKSRLSMLNALLLLFAAAMTSCSTIDDDLSNCGRDYSIDYTLHLVTNIETELSTVLYAETDQVIADALRDELTQSIFREFAADVNLAFYDTDDQLEKHEIEQMNANQASYTIYLPVKEYTHLALANIANAGSVSLDGYDHASTSTLVQAKGDTIDSHSTGLFTARQKMEVLADQDQDFLIPLYMANSAAAIVIDTAGYRVRDVRTYINKVGDSFALRDSTYTYSSNTVIRMNDVQLPESTRKVCRYGVCFPSSDEGGWEIRCYVTLEDGTVTENILTVSTPLQAGQLKILTVKLTDQGVIEVTTTEASVSVTLDWKQGGTYEPTM